MRSATMLLSIALLAAAGFKNVVVCSLELWSSPFSESLIDFSSPPAQLSSQGIPKYNYTDDSRVTFLLQGNINIHLNYVTDDGEKEVVIEDVPWLVNIDQTYHNSTFPKVMETNLTWGPAQEFILQFTLVTSKYLWKVANVTFYFTRVGPFVNVSSAVDKVSLTQDLFLTPLNHAYKCSSVDIGQLIGTNSTTADVVVRKFELQAFNLDSCDFSPGDAALSQVAPVVIGSVIGVTVLLILTAYVTSNTYKGAKERKKRRVYELLQ